MVLTDALERSAPAAINNFTASSCPFFDAHHKAVSPTRYTSTDRQTNRQAIHTNIHTNKHVHGDISEWEERGEGDWGKRLCVVGLREC